MVFGVENIFELKNVSTFEVYERCQKWIQSTRKSFPVASEEMCKLYLKSRGRLGNDMPDPLPNNLEEWKNFAIDFQIISGQKIYARSQIAVFHFHDKFYCCQTIAFLELCDNVTSLYRHIFSLASNLGDYLCRPVHTMRLHCEPLVDLGPSSRWISILDHQFKAKTPCKRESESASIEYASESCQEIQKENENLKSRLSLSEDKLNKARTKIRNLENINVNFKQNIEIVKKENVILNRKINTLENKYAGEIKKILKESEEKVTCETDEVNKRAKQEIDEYCKIFDNESEKLKMENRQLRIENNKLLNENAMLNGKLKTVKGKLGKSNISTDGIILATPNEDEKYRDEYIIAIMSALHMAFASAGKKANSQRNRSGDIWRSFIDANSQMEEAYRDYADKYTELLDTMKRNEFDLIDKKLKFFNIKLDSYANNHGKFTFYSDNRYQACVASTASDTVSGPINAASDFKNAFLFPI